MKPKFKLLLCLLIASSSVMAQFNANGVVAHRSAWKTLNIPQNSIEGLQRAMELGCYAAEIDIHITKDNVPVVNHDHDFMGIPIETSNYEDLLAAQLPNGEPIPTLEEYILETLKHPSIKLWVDIKNSRVSKARTVDIGAYSARVVKKLGAEERIEFIGPNFDALVKVLMELPSGRALYIGSDKEPEVLKELGFVGVDLGYKRFAAGEYSVKEAKAAGLMVGSYTVDSAEEMRTQLEAGVDYITTNEPELLLEVASEMKREGKL